MNRHSNNNNNPNNNNVNTNNNDNRTAQGGSNGNQTYLILTREELTRAIKAAIYDHLNIKIEPPDIFQLSIEVMYCEATIEQQPIYLILDTGPKKSGINSEEIDEEENEEKYEAEEVKKEKSYIVQRDEDELSIVEIKRNAMSIERKETNIGQYKEIEEEKLKGDKEESCTGCKELFKDIETLECLVNNLDEELGISQKIQKYTNLEKNQQAKVEELMKNNKVLFAEG
ncbi:hypothetical protein F8M41_007963 [Gigaspora margarita]|uniref:Uncharacterized protein n=1 Tax=Gigaspora margarita TaxID=4874 RepID=A0A8H3X452_GIGMA|nr:hypothetical protein F8M41_007963 [Gigaspora margarita]